MRDAEVSLEAGQDPEACVDRLTEIPGIGPWTAHYIAMRGLRWPDAFPHSDLGLRAALGGRPASVILRMAEAWRPRRAYVAMHLWEGLAAEKVDGACDEPPATPISMGIDRRHYGPSRRQSGETKAVNYAFKVIDSPVGKLKLVASAAGLAAILWEHDDPRRVPLDACEEAPEHPVLVETQRQLREYFEGERTSFSLALDFKGTEFQKRVWEALLTIPCGEKRSYGQIAEQVGNARALRAVGAAIGKNPISIIAPCHRVVGSTGKLTGFAGGLEVKERLLALESAGRR